MNSEQYILNTLKDNFKLKLEEANFSKGYIPKYILLDRSRNIHSYFLLCNYYMGKLSMNSGNTDLSNEKIINFLKTQYSQLDRPLFFVINLDNNVLRIIESEVIRYELLESPNTNIVEFMIKMSDNIVNVLPKIIREL